MHGRLEEQRGHWKKISDIKGPPLKPLFLSEAGISGQPVPHTPCSAFDAILEGIYLPKKAIYLSGRLEDLLPADLPLRAKGGRPITNPFWEMLLFGKGVNYSNGGGGGDAPCARTWLCPPREEAIYFGRPSLLCHPCLQPEGR